MTFRTIDEIAAALRAIDMAALRWEVAKAHAIREWALHHVGVDYHIGDRVVIVTEIPTANGWYAYRESLVQGATGVVDDIDFNPYADNGRGAWHASVALDRAWAVADTFGTVKRHWKGKVTETPPGFEPPDAYTQEKYPNGKRKVFALRVEWVRLYRRLYQETKQPVAVPNVDDL
jgi:hypothetical protein